MDRWCRQSQLTIVPPIAVSEFYVINGEAANDTPADVTASATRLVVCAGP